MARWHHNRHRTSATTRYHYVEVIFRRVLPVVRCFYDEIFYMQTRFLYPLYLRQYRTAEGVHINMGNVAAS
jgi:hypothetical protein